MAAARCDGAAASANRRRVIRAGRRCSRAEPSGDRTPTLAVISDTHLPRGKRTLPVRCLELCSAADLIVHCGDVCSLEAWHTMASLGPPLVGVRGNMDEAALRELLPEERVVEFGGARIGLVHIGGPAAGRAARLRAAFPGCDAVVYGHTHIPEVTREDGVWILNPGSPTERRRSPVHAMLLLEVEAGKIRPDAIEL